MHKMFSREGFPPNKRSVREWAMKLERERLKIYIYIYLCIVNLRTKNEGRKHPKVVLCFGVCTVFLNYHFEFFFFFFGVKTQCQTT